MPEAVISAPAPETTPQIEETPVTQTPTTAASDAGSFTQFQDAKRAERAGKPLAPVEKPEPVDAPRELSKRQLDANERTKKAVDLATADLRAEIDRLKAAQPALQPSPTPTAVVSAPEPARTPEWKEFAAMPDAPKLNAVDKDGQPMFASLEEHAAAMSVFVNGKMHERREAISKAESETKEIHAREQAHIDSFQKQITDAGGTDGFVSKLAPAVQALRPAEAVLATDPKAQVGPLNVLTSWIIKSAVAPKILQYLSDHPDSLSRFSACKNVGEVFTEAGFLMAKMDAPTPATTPAVAPKTVTSMTAPAAVIGQRTAASADPERTAVNKHDFSSYRAARLAERAASRS